EIVCEVRVVARALQAERVRARVLRLHRDAVRRKQTALRRVVCEIYSQPARLIRHAQQELTLRAKQIAHTRRVARTKLDDVSLLATKLLCADGERQQVLLFVVEKPRRFEPRGEP